MLERGGGGGVEGKERDKRRRKKYGAWERKKAKSGISEKAGMAWEAEEIVRKAKTPVAPTHILISGPLLKIYVVISRR